MANKMVDLDKITRLAAALDARMKSQVADEADRAMEVEADLQQSITDTRDMLGGKSIVYLTQSEYDSLTDEEKNSDDVAYFVTDAPDSTHTHENMDFLNSLDEEEYMQLGADIQALQNLVSNLEDLKANASALAEYQKHTDNTLSTDDKTIVGSINEVVGNLSDYIVEMQGIVQGLNQQLANKIEASALTPYQPKQDNSLITDDKTVVGAINELVQSFASMAGLTILPIQAKLIELQNLVSDLESSKQNKTDEGLETTNKTVVAAINEVNNSASRAYILGMGLLENIQGIEAALGGKSDVGHTHDDRYYTESEINDKIDDINEAINSNVATLNSAITTAKSGAISESKSYTDTAITNLVNSAPEAMNTLNELAAAINNHQDEYEAYVNTVSANIATAKTEAIAEAAKKDTALHTTISAEIDADVKTEKERAMEAEAALQAAINGKADVGHAHDDKYYGKNELDNRFNNIGTAFNNLTSSFNEMAAELESKSDVGHNHDDRYYTESEINNKIDDINEAIEGRAPSEHTHTLLSTNIDNYRTVNDAPSTYERGESLFFVNAPETNFNGLQYGLVQTLKEYTSGNAAWQFLYPYNDKSDTFYVRNGQYGEEGWRSWAEVYTSLNKPTPADIGAAPSSHSHDDKYYTEVEIDSKIGTINTALNGKSNTDHTHDDRYYTESEINTKVNALNEADATLQANMTREVGRVETMLGGKSFVYLTQSEYDGLTNEQKGDTSKIYVITDAVDPTHEHSNKEFLDALSEESLRVIDALSLNGYKIWVGTSADLENVTKDTNTLYFEIDEEAQNDDDVVQVDIVNGVLTLTKDKYQKTNMVTGTQIVFPEVSNLTELHLYFDAEENMNLIFPDNCRWRVDANIESGKSYEIVATYNTMHWLVNVIVYS